MDTFAYGYRLTDEELHEYVMELLKEEQNWEAQPTTTHGQSFVWAHSSDNTI